MGYAIARASRMRGASVTLVSGPTALGVPFGVRCESVKTTEDMKRSVMEKSSEADVIIKAAAVSDYRPRETAKEKIKKESGSLSIELVKNPDILSELGKIKEKNNFLLVGFAAETGDLLANAAEKLRKKNLDMIVANDVSREDAGFETDTNLVKILYRDGREEDLPLMSKDDVANHLLDRIKRLRDDSL
jgi:phosphopantothenoylcysteine decarboxylase/phosphopantothenate--cysteine ligase